MAAPDGWLIRAGGVGPEAATAAWWDAWQAAMEKAWSTQVAAALAALIARGPVDETDPSRPFPPALPTDAWALIMDRLASCRCGVISLQA